MTKEKRCGRCRFFAKSRCTRTKLEFPSDEEDLACGEFVIK